MDITVREALPADVHALCALYEAFFAYNAALRPEYYREAAESGGYPRAVMAEHDTLLLVAEADGILAGLLHAEIRGTPPYACFVPHAYAEVVDLFVTESLRGRGIGGALIDAAEKWAAERGLDYLELSVLHGNDRAEKFYRNQAFQPVSRLMRRSVKNGQ